MAVSTAGTQSNKVDSFAGVLHEVTQLAVAVGPAWGLVLLIALCVFAPRVGLIAYLAKLYKEDRADARKRTLETEQLAVRYKTRKLIKKPSSAKSLPPGSPTSAKKGDQS